ncbi:hypothetical protein [Dactylosporangium sp. NPDC051484]|uniref:hypothetical protein n=1 Tax=Dactylosporangium sp. NPDC051484 TaxID=3154942 RepID=UPI0034501627
MHTPPPSWDEVAWLGKEWGGRSGIDSALMSLCLASVHDLTPDDVLTPDGFAAVLGGAR